MRSTFKRCAVRMVVAIPLATLSMAPVSASAILGTAGAFAILGGAGVAVNGTGSVITGSVGGCCGATTVTGYPAGFTDSGGTVYDSGTLPAGAETSAQADLGTAITALTG